MREYSCIEVDKTKAEIEREREKKEAMKDYVLCCHSVDLWNKNTWKSDELHRSMYLLFILLS